MSFPIAKKPPPLRLVLVATCFVALTFTAGLILHQRTLYHGGLPALPHGSKSAVSLPPVTVTKAISLPQPTFDMENAMSLESRLARWDGYITKASKRFDVPKDWIVAVMRQESGGRTVLEGDLPITSTTGAMGIMQVMPGTYVEMRAQYGLGADPYDPHDNVLAGTAYLKWLHGKYGYPAMFAAYNDGPGNIELSMAGKHDLPAETLAYLANIRTHLGDAPQKEEGKTSGIATLTRPDGQTVTIAGLNVKSVRAVLPGEYPQSAASVIDMGKSRQAVREDVASATQLLRLAGAKL